MCLRRAPEKYIAGAKAPAGAALDRAALHVLISKDKYGLPTASSNNQHLNKYSWNYNESVERINKLRRTLSIDTGTTAATV
jgi:hypothetical protein